MAIPLLESHVVIFPEEARCFDSLAELYRWASARVSCLQGPAREDLEAKASQQPHP